MRGKRTEALLLLLLIAAFGIGIVWGPGAARPEAPALAPADAVQAPHRPDATKGTERAEATAELDPVAGATSDRQAVAGSIRIVGRCIAAEDGAPIADCELLVRLLRAGAATYDVPEDRRTVRSRADGSVDVAIEPPAGRAPVTSVYYVAQRHDRAATHGAVEPAAGFPFVADMGTLVLARGSRLRGIAVDPSGNPVAEVRFHLTYCDHVPFGPTHLQPGPPPESSVIFSTDRDGWFHSWTPIPFGTWLLSLEVHGHYFVSSPELAFSDPSQRFRVVLATAPTLQGIVVDEHERPLAGVQLNCYLDGGCLMTQSGADGRFLLRADRHYEGEVPLQCQLHGFEATAPAAPLRWGATDNRIIMRRVLTGALRLALIAKETRHPIEAHVQIGIKRAMSDRDGRATIADAPAGVHECTITPVDRRYRPAVVKDVVIKADGTTERCVLVELLATLKVRVEDAAGRAIAGARVGTIDHATCTSDAGQKGIFGLAEAECGLMETMDSIQWRLLAETRTDDAGQCQVLAPANQYETALLAEAPGYLPLRCRGPWQLDSTGSVTLKLQPTGSLRGTLHGLDPTWGAAIRLSRQLPPGSLPMAEYAQPDASGQFELPDLEPGIWEAMVLVLPARSAMAEAFPASGFPLPLDLPDIVIRASEQASLRIDASRIRPATVIGCISVDGQALPSVHLRLRHRRPAESCKGFWHDWGASIGMSGRFEIRGLPPGTWDATVQLGMARPHRVIGLDEPWMLASGEVAHRDLEVPLRTLRVRIERHDGAPAANIAIRYGELCVTTDAQGTAILGPCGTRRGAMLVGDPPAEYDIEFPHGGGELFREVILK